MSLISKTPKPPYYAVIFTSHRSVHSNGDDGYDEMAVRMEELASQQAGFLGVESAREEVGITVSYWNSLESIKNWKANTEHQQAQKNGRSLWYSNFTVRICKVERDYCL